MNIIIEEYGVLYPIEIKMTGNPKASMLATSSILNNIPDKKVGTRIIICLVDKKTYLKEALIALPVEYI